MMEEEGSRQIQRLTENNDLTRFKKTPLKSGTEREANTVITLFNFCIHNNLMRRWDTRGCDASYSWVVCVTRYSLHCTFLLPQSDLYYSMWSFPLILIINNPQREMEREEGRLEPLLFFPSPFFHVKSSGDVSVGGFFQCFLDRQKETIREGRSKLK